MLAARKNGRGSRGAARRGVSPEDVGAALHTASTRGAAGPGCGFYADPPRDRCWDLALTLDGDISNQPKAINRPLADFVRALPGLATGGTPDGSRALVDELAEDLRRVEWSLPDPFQDVAFAVNGLDGRVWRPEACDRLGIISPFCDDETLKMLAALWPKPGRPC